MTDDRLIVTIRFTGAADNVEEWRLNRDDITRFEQALSSGASHAGCYHIIQGMRTKSVWVRYANVATFTYDQEEATAGV